MTTITKTTDLSNHVRNDYQVDKVFVNFPNRQKKLTIVNGTTSERTVKAGTLVGLTTADQTVAKELASASTDGSEIPYGFVLYDVTIAAGASEEADVMVGFGDDKSSIIEDQITLAGSDTLDTVITQLGISIRSAIRAYTLIKVEPTPLDISDYKDAQI